MEHDTNKNINDNNIKIDPDYESTNNAIRRVKLQEINEKKLTEDKLKTIIQEEFDKELDIRQKQLIEIENKIYNAQKLLHVLRYVIVSSYYGDKSEETNDNNAASTSTNNNSTYQQQQNRIHPAIKKLLGNNVKNLNFSTGRGKRKSTIKSNQLKNNSLHHSESKRIKLEENTEENAIQENLKLVGKDAETNRAKIRYRALIGNISICKESLEENNLPYRWMVYVKLYKDYDNEAEVTNDMISKVVFHLHSSYKPDDVVEVCEAPFHLTRRGWGEFPLRVKIFFKSSMNKPVDIIHQLKLNNTFTERQTLGNKTIVPIFLYEPSSDIKPINNDDEDIVKIENEIKLEIPDSSYDHDYCYDNLIINDESMNFLQDHPYSMAYDELGFEKKSPKKSKTPIKQSPNQLIHGLGRYYLDPRGAKIKYVKKNLCNEENKKNDNNSSSTQVLKTLSGQSIRFLPESFNKVLKNNGNIVSVKFVTSPPTSPTSTLQEITHLPNKFKCMGELLPYLFKRIPLWNGDSYDEEEFLKLNIGKQLVAEWTRAKTIKKILSSTPFSNKLWNTKAIFMYGRAHLYSPLKNYQLFKHDSFEKELILNCYQCNNDHLQHKNNCLNNSYHNMEKNNHQQEENINIITSSPEKNAVIKRNINDVNNTQIRDKINWQKCKFIKEIALDVGVIIKPEILNNNILMNVTEKLLYEMIKCFADQLIRRSANFLICSGQNNCQSLPEISVNEIRKALKERKEYEAINKFKEKRIEMEFYS